MVKPAQNFSGYHRVFNYCPPPIDDEGGFELVHHDHDILVLNKPSGLLSVPGKSADLHDCLVERVQAVFPDARIVHRLDMDTSGIMVFARNPAAQRHLGLQFERRHIRKVYLAHIMGHLEQVVSNCTEQISNHENDRINSGLKNIDLTDLDGLTGMLQLPLICDWPNRPLQMVCFERGKKARTDWQVLSYGHRDYGDGQTMPYTTIALYPVTGRSHQLRVHMRALGHPILGDRLYAPDDGFEAAPRLMLHALALSLHHPKGGERMEFRAPSDDFDGTDDVEI